MIGVINTIDKISAWVGKTFAWCIMILAFGTGYEVFVRYLLRDPTPWAFDMSYMMYGTLFMMAGAYTLSRDGHVRGDVVYRLWKPRTQAKVELALYILLFYPGVLALMFAGWKYASRSIRYGEVSVMSPANVPIFQFKVILVVAGALLAIQGIAQVLRCVSCIKTGTWPQQAEDVEELEDQLLRSGFDIDGNIVPSPERTALKHGSEAIDVIQPDTDAGLPPDRTKGPDDGGPTNNGGDKK